MAHFGKFLAELRRSRGMSQAELAVRAELSMPTISLLERSAIPKGKSATRSALAEALGLTWPQMEAQWRGHPAVVPAEHRLHQGGQGQDLIPIINATPAGPVHDYEDVGVEHYKFLPVRGDALGDREAFAVQVVGDSMSPKYVEGDVVILSPAAAVVDGDPVFVRFDGSRDGCCTLKLYHALDAQRVELRPYNPAHKPLVVRREEIIRMARVVFVFRREA